VSDDSSGPAGLPDPGRIANQQDFGRELTRLRERAGKTIRQVAAEAQVPPSTAGDYFTGSHLPQASARPLLRRILAACGETDPAVVGQWMDAVTRVRRAPGRRAAGIPPPYRGLASFEAEHAQWFFGRAALTRLLVDLAADRSADAHTARYGSADTADDSSAGPPGPAMANVPLMVTGPSGGGKSSLLRAGLIPALRARTRHRTIAASPRLLLFTPGPHPIRALAELLVPDDPDTAEAALHTTPWRSAELAGGIRPPGLAVIVDQFEEIFTECEAEADRGAFISALCALGSPALVVLGLRSAFYGRARTYPQLAVALQERHIVVGPMNEAELRSAIVEPARVARLNVEDGLVEVLLRDLAPPAQQGAPDAAYEAGALALLSQAMLITWERSRGALLTVAAYTQSGGIRDAISGTAEAVFGQLSADQAGPARRLFLRLVQITDGIAVRRRIPLGEACRGNDASVLAAFVAQRLITVDAYAAEIAHEALLTAWPRLRGWIEADREWLRMRRRISEAARAWRDGGRDPSGLLRGSPLAIARDSAADPAGRARFSRLEQEFLDAGIAAQRAERAAGRRRTLRARAIVAALGVALVAIVSLVGYAAHQRAGVNAALEGAYSRDVAAEASQIRASDVSVAAQLSLAAYQIAPTSPALSSLLESSGAPKAARLLDSLGTASAVALSPDRTVLAVAAGDGTLRLWDVARPGQPSPLGPPVARLPSALCAAAFGPGGRLLAAAGADDRIRLWDTLNPRRPRQDSPPLTGPAGSVYGLAFSPDGRLLAAGSADHTVRLWDTGSPGHPQPLATLTGPAGYVASVAFSPDGTALAAGSADGTVRLWRLTRSGNGGPVRGPVSLGRPLTGPAAIVDAIAFSPDSHTLAAGSRDDDVWLWNITDPARPKLARAPLTGATGWVNAVAFSPDGRQLAAGSSDDTALAWQLATGALTFRLPHPVPVLSLAWDGPHDLVTGAADGTVRLWAVPPPVLNADGPVHKLSLSPDGRTLAVGTADLTLWDIATRTRIGAAAVAGTFVSAVAFSPNGEVIAAGYGNGTIQLWRAASSGPPTPFGPPLRASATGPVEFAAFQRDGTVLATAGNDGTVRLWDVARPQKPGPLRVIQASVTTVFTAVFSPNGHAIAAANADGTVRLWNVMNLTRPVALGLPLTGPQGAQGEMYSVAFSPDGRVLAAGSDKTIRLWNVARPARPYPLGRPLTGPGGQVYSLAFSPDGRALAAGVADGSVWLWRTSGDSAPAARADLAAAGGHVHSVAFGPGGQVIAAAGADGTVRLWDTEPGPVAADLCAMAGDPLTRAEWNRYVPGVPYAPPCRHGRPAR
jgi:WD40 repeat protein